MKSAKNSLARKERKAQKKLIKRERYFQKYGIYPPNLQEKKEVSGLKNTGKMLRYFKGQGWRLTILVGLMALAVAVDVTSSFNLAIVVDKVVAGDFATMVKLTRTLAIIPTVITFAFIQLNLKRKEAQATCQNDSSIKANFSIKKYSLGLLLVLLSCPALQVFSLFLQQ